LFAALLTCLLSELKRQQLNEARMKLTHSVVVGQRPCLLFSKARISCLISLSNALFKKVQIVVVLIVHNDDGDGQPVSFD